MSSASEFNRRMRAAQRKAEQQFKREVDRVNRENQRRVDAFNRKTDTANKAEMARVNREIGKVNRENKRRVDNHNRKVDTHNKKVIDQLNARLGAQAPTVTYRSGEAGLVERVHVSIDFDDGHDYDVFISYARIDGESIATTLRRLLEEHGVSVWLDKIAIQPGRSQARQMDVGLAKAPAGIAILTPAYLAGRFWTERELGALLSKDVLIPVLDQVTFDDVREYSGVLPDLAGFETALDDLPTIADKIIPALLPPTN